MESILDQILEMHEIKTIPAGQYIARFKDLQKSEHPEYGAGLCWSFEIAAGEYKGCLVSRITKPDLRSTNIGGKMFRAVTGDSKPTSLKPFVGKPYNVLMEPTAQDKTRISQVWPYQPQAQTAPVATEQAEIKTASQMEEDFIPF